MNTIETSLGQHAIWFTERAGVAAGAYTIAFAIRFGAGLDERALAEACAAVVERHPLLSTAVASDAGDPVLIPAADKIALDVDEHAGDRLRAHLARPFDLDAGPLARFTLLRARPDGGSLLLFTAHHLVCDGVSKDVIAHDLAAAYGAALAGEPVDLGTPDPIAQTYARDERIAAELPRAREFWRSHWTAAGQLVLPDLRRAPVTAGPGATVPVPIPAEVADRIGTAARELGVTRFELLLTAVQALLSRYGNAGLPVSVALSTRTARAAREVGLHVNELPVTVAPPEGTVREYAHSVRARLRKLYRVRTVPLAYAVGGLRPATALTPVSVSYRRQDTDPVFPGVPTTTEWTMPAVAVRNALTVLIVDGPDRLRIDLHHHLEAVPGDAAARIAGHLAVLLKAAVTGPRDRPVAALPVLPASEHEQVLRRFNATSRPLPPDATVPAMFAAAVAARPDAVAVTDAGRNLTYAELDAAAEHTATALRQRGVGAGSLVAVGLTRGWQTIATLLAIMRCGAAYVPVDPAYPAARRALILDDAAPALVIDSLDPPTGSATASPQHPPHPRELAYVIYTSGSTGRPKGVAVPHAALANLLLAMRDLLGSRPTDRWLWLTSLSFDISGLEVFLPLVTGGRVVVAPDGATTDGATVDRIVRDHRVTHVQATPSGWRILLDAGFEQPDTVTALTGGEALPASLAQELRPRVTRLFNVYGPTETTIWSTAAEMPIDTGEVTIGHPIANTRAYVLDGAGSPVPIGITGELHLAGDGVADGYLRNPALTEQRFRADPFGPGRMYATGDLCQWRPDGHLVYIGRRDDQVKIRGHRVELGEIEARLHEHPRVAEAAVVLHYPDDTDSGRLVGYIVPRGPAPDPADLRHHLAQTLPAVMVPTVWSTMERLPRTPNGKLDRAALPEPPRKAPAAPVTAAPGPPGGDTLLAELTTIWEQVLRIDDIGPDEDLFDLGGHSLSITRISSRIQQRYGVHVPLDAFFDTPTVAEIATIVRRSLDTQAGTR
ncbi:non-ribosomal peptide synthetase [Phytohabitans aurantiacus]|uniref:Carrier domain-containing protein n=1 Tax=Phytohabitans aurantiacus TaxID=3016789 RepID=A0ABQ5QVU3_9ACTN|nr:non-ribosomal peptide synthetase [Phytohabitans aurantiacus]GLH98152.1 hypothetical protein Pa4123_34270 [Phytohabitans aurantiacus]